jgi:hypothetical protein
MTVRVPQGRAGASYERLSNDHRGCGFFAARELTRGGKALAMSDAAKVSVVKYPDREHLILRWRDPLSGKSRCKTSGTTKRREAERKAAALEREILDGHHGPAARMGWAEFREYHEEHCLRALADRTFDAYVCALNVYERFHKPDRLSDITAARVTAWQTELRKEGKSEASIASYTRHLKATLRWAHEQRLLAMLPMLAMPKRAKVRESDEGSADHDRGV